MTKNEAERENWASYSANNRNGGGLHRPCGSVYQKTIFELKNQPGVFGTYWECHTCVSPKDIERAVSRLANRRED